MKCVLQIDNKYHSSVDCASVLSVSMVCPNVIATVYKVVSSAHVYGATLDSLWKVVHEHHKHRLVLDEVACSKRTLSCLPFRYAQNHSSHDTKLELHFFFSRTSWLIVSNTSLMSKNKAPTM